MEIFLTREEVKSLLQISTNTLRKLEKEGMPFTKVTKKAFRYNKEAVLSWLKQNKGGN